MAIHETRIDEPTGYWVVPGEDYVHESRKKNCLGCQFHNDLVPTICKPTHGYTLKKRGFGFQDLEYRWKNFLIPPGKIGPVSRPPQKKCSQFQD